MQGLALGLNAGLGNAGVSVMQFLIPWAITFGMFGALGGAPQEFVKDGATHQLWIQNAALIWVPIMTVLAIAGLGVHEQSAAAQLRTDTRGDRQSTCGCR